MKAALMTDTRQVMADLKVHTIAEVAAALRVSRMTVYRLVKNGELEAVRVGRSFRVREDALRDYVTSQTRGGYSE